MNITGIEIVVSRKRQPATYEEGACSVKLNASVAEGEDYKRILGDLLDTAAYFVSNRVGLPHEGKPVFGGSIATVAVKTSDGQTASTTAPVAEPKQEKPKKEKKTETQVEPPLIRSNPENRVDPAQSEIPATKPIVPPTPAPEIPSTPAPTPPAAPAEEITQDALSSFISDKARAKASGGKGFTVEQVHEMRTKFGVSKLADLKPEQRPLFKIALEKLIS